MNPFYLLSAASLSELIGMIVFILFTGFPVLLCLVTLGGELVEDFRENRELKRQEKARRKRLADELGLTLKQIKEL